MLVYVSLSNNNDLLIYTVDGGDTCFDICIGSFNQRQINDKEIKCIKSCTDKFFHVQARCMKRWQQQMQLQQKKQQQFIEYDELYQQKIQTLQPAQTD